ncbi:AraC family transcriptional regulator [Ruminococcus sp. OA3]|uniref:AraC family transcriptional regulator n=1 Tax=Ruminococcus sp. OA3 TaxID=2914164 RepID=UPI001F062D1A|nr:AraC family transcriptional regulator [Ruminococcus sp. OA3]MCH1982636.1 AraC family transcriptional regulator [Ruminococcus sp. OA3]
MSYQLDMERCLAYIETKVTEPLPVSALASMFGYSLYHFCHAFKSIYGLSAGAYIRQRRLAHAAIALCKGYSVTYVALTYGFETVSGFNKAFRKQYALTPTEYMIKGGTEAMMTPAIKKLQAFSAIGYCLAPPQGELDVLDNGAYWLGKDFSSVSLEEYQKLTYPGYAEIGAWTHPDAESGELHYFFGPIVKSKDFVPHGMEVLDVPAAEYAVFLVPSAKDIAELNMNIRKMWKDIFSKWLDSSQYKFMDGKLSFEYYCGEKTWVYIPVTYKHV